MDAPYLNCDGCRTSMGRAGCPTHRQNNAVTIAPSVQWSSSEPVLTHCVHGLDLRLHPRCYLCHPAHEHGWALGGELAAPPSDPAAPLDVERLGPVLDDHYDQHAMSDEDGHCDRLCAAEIAREYAALTGAPE